MDRYLLLVVWGDGKASATTSGDAEPAVAAGETEKPPGERREGAGAAGGRRSLGFGSTPAGDAPHTSGSQEAGRMTGEASQWRNRDTRCQP